MRMIEIDKELAEILARFLRMVEQAGRENRNIPNETEKAFFKNFMNKAEKNLGFPACVVLREVTQELAEIAFCRGQKLSETSKNMN
jgi:hypothetical protein